MKTKARKIYIATSSFGEYDDSIIKKIKMAGGQIEINPYKRTLTEAEALNLYADIDGLIAGTEPITAAVLQAAKNLKVISRCGAGRENVDMKMAENMGIKVFYTPDAPTLAVAELTLGLILNMLLKVNCQDRAIRKGQWNKLMGNLLSGKKVGLIGFGRIGKKVAELLVSFDCRIAYHDPFIERRFSNIESLSLDELLRWADIVSLHVSENKELLGEREFQQIKPGAWLINVSRGKVVNENILYRKLKEGYLSGAALDVYEREPYLGPLKELDNVILTPHIGSYAREARIRMENEAAENLLKGLEV